MNEESQQLTTFGLLRHGQTVWNLEKRIQGSGNSALTEAGIDFCEKWGQQLTAGQPKWTRIIASPLQRTRLTAEIVNRSLHLPIKIVEGIREQYWGQWEGLTIDEIKAKFSEDFNNQIQRGWQFRPTGGESREEVRQRVLAALTAECGKKKDENILVISHLGVIKSILYSIENRAYLPEEPRLGHKNRFHTISCRGNEFSIVRKDIELQDT